MKKVILAAALGLFFTTFACAQSSKTLTTDIGSKVVEIRQDGSSVIKFSSSEWSSMVSPRPSATTNRICITIASRNQNCAGGIGFRCGVFDCPIPPKSPALSRVQPATYVVDGNQVIVTFSNPIDWDTLMN